jgi:hypothetical protein
MVFTPILGRKECAMKGILQNIYQGCKSLIWGTAGKVTQAVTSLACSPKTYLLIAALAVMFVGGSLDVFAQTGDSQPLKLDSIVRGTVILF